MADYFTKFSLVIELANETQQSYALNLANEASSAKEGNPLPDNFPASLVDVVEVWDFETEAEGNSALWLHSRDGGVFVACLFIQHLLQKFDPQGKAAFEWSHDCSKPRLDAYGGGAAVITAQKIKTMHTADWVKEQTSWTRSSRLRNEHRD